MPIGTLRLVLEIKADDGSTALEYAPGPIRWALGAALGNGDRRLYSIPTLTFQTLTVPSGARLLILIPAEGSTSLVLKGVTADTGVNLRAATNPLDGPTVLFLGTSPSIGIYNGASATQSVEALFV